MSQGTMVKNYNTTWKHYHFMETYSPLIYMKKMINGTGEKRTR